MVKQNAATFCHELAPLVREALIDELKEVPYYTTLFDESYNRVSRKSQMDLDIRFWDKTGTWLKLVIGLISSLDKNKILQRSTDGPNVNLAF